MRVYAVLEIDTMSRLPTVRHFHSCCRLVLAADDSAGKIRRKRSRDGNRYLEQAFHTATIRAAQYYPEIRQEYRRRDPGTQIPSAGKKPDAESARQKL